MSRWGRALDNPINWSFGVGRLFGIAIRIHLLFILGAVWILAWELHEKTGGLAMSLGMIGLLFLIVLIHEFGHCFGARRVGGSAEQILLWPLGGLASVDVPHKSRAHLITALAGPAVNVIFCIATAAVLIASTGSFSALPWNPFGGIVIVHGESVRNWLVIFFGLNYIILLFNLAPVFPFDGGRVLQSLLWPRMGYRDSMMLATGVGMIGAIGFGIIGLFTEAYLLFAIAVFGYLTCRQQRLMAKEGLFDEGGACGYDFSQGHTSFERSAEAGEPTPSVLTRWRAKREETRRLRETERIEAERQEADAILAKIARDGIDSLTPRERQTLKRETERQTAAGPRND